MDPEQVRAHRGDDEDAPADQHHLAGRAHLARAAYGLARSMGAAVAKRAPSRAKLRTRAAIVSRSLSRDAPKTTAPTRTSRKDAPSAARPSSLCAASRSTSPMRSMRPGQRVCVSAWATEAAETRTPRAFSAAQIATATLAFSR